MRSLILSLAAFCASLAVAFGLSLTTARAAEVTLLAVERPGGPEVTDVIAWSVVKVNKETGKPDAKPTMSGNGPRLMAKLDPGQYLVTAKLGNVQASQAILVGKTATTRSLVLADPAKAGKTVSKKADAGPPAQLSINMKLSKGKNPIKEPVHWEVFTYEKGGTDAGEKVAEQKAATGQFSLPGGSYVVRAHFKGTKADLVIPIEAGQSLKYTLNLYAGYVKLTALKTKKQKTSAEALTWQILRQRPNAPGIYELVASSEKAEPTIMLREGRYIAVARLGSKMWGSEPLVIMAGQTANKKINLKEGVGAPEIAAAN